MPVQSVGKGEQIQLSGRNTLTKLAVGLGWDPNEGQSQHSFHLDASIVTRKQDGEAIDVCYYGAKKLGNYIEHIGDGLTGEGAGDDAQIKIDLSAIPADVYILDVVVNIYDSADRKRSFGIVNKAYVRLLNAENNNAETLRYTLTDVAAFEERGIHFARIKRDGSTWTFEAPSKHFDKAYDTLQNFANTKIPA